MSTECWPQYQSPYDALVGETAGWGSRLQRAESLYANLSGELPPAMGKVAIGIVDGAEVPEDFSMLDIYNRHNLDGNTFGALLLVNYQGSTMPDNTKALLEAIKAQREHANIPTAISTLGFNERRMFDDLREIAWDMGVVHALKHKIKHPIVGLSNDADMAGASADYFPSMFENEYVGQHVAWSSAIEYDQPGGAELPLNKLLAYLNVGKGLFGMFKGTPVLYGGSMALTLDTYTTSGGWKRKPDKFSHAYGAGEPSNIALNIWQRRNGALGEDIEDEDIDPAYRQCAKRVGGIVRVSPRREMLAYATRLGNPEVLIEHMNTKADNPYRSLSRATLEQLATTVKTVDNDLFRRHLNTNDTTWLNALPKDRAEDVKAVLRAARERIGLPIAAFDQTA